ncbi:uncharacterized protein LOC130207978 [Pseudoliparis swirei]|uniref:uncharacterized protein LOC130207978 n=1 Tax=Pseudoliparis swirei TaxID=2059687 RepID=UPI0024BEE553|nr:uncharacterized protein LOC130207978 [Pseudoliparis swirei]
MTGFRGDSGNDKNLCSKALLSGVNALSKNDLEDQNAVLSDVLELEMKAVFEDLWLEVTLGTIVFLKPPWTLHDVLRCLKKHWIAVFGQVAPRRQLDNVLHLIDFFNSGQTATCDTTAAAVRQAKELVNVFRERSRLVPGAVSTMENIDNALRPPPPCEAPARDVDMNDTEEEEPRRPTRRCGPCLRPRGPACLRGAWRCSEFWALTTTPRRGRWGGGVLRRRGLPARAAVRGRPAAPSLQQIADMDSRLTTTDLLDCFSREDYREKLMTGGNQLTGLKEVLDRCLGTTAAPP